ncbi:MAG: DNA glycosylase [Christensenella sp.]|uniref:DNA-3-methyladenine glycosylase family protein n=1 Tax=Christensenella sp. TaxID=1935934 RepID=UPI002B21E425|nr:DNA glycosylase [Christensenella sp.]MEA5002469.1 DNA glycosylase [Christensenella sp.]
MEVSFLSGAVVLTGMTCFEPRHIFDNGQTFRFDEVAHGVFEGVAHGRFLRVTKNGDTVTLFPSSADEYNGIWKNYFDLETNYDGLFCDCGDEALRKGREYGCGLRLLNQQPFETLIAFIVSANNNLKRIKGILRRICDRCGQPFLFEGKTYYAFPKPAELAAMDEQALKECGSGYRAPYIREAARMVASGFDLETLRAKSYPDAKKELVKLPGVGPKVADCILLFALGFRDAFPADVWIKRVLKEHYGFEGNDRQAYAFAKEKFGEYAGIAQQYLFFWQRDKEKQDDEDNI